MTKSSVVLLVPLLLSGCATGLNVTYHSDPEGATIYQDGRPMGRTPVTLTYQADEAFKNGSCQRGRGLEARWVSGATTSISHFSFCRNVGWSQQYTFVRPDTPGREVDASYSLQLQRNAILQQQANAASMAAAAALLNPGTASGGGFSSTGTAFLKRSYNSGFNTVCIYNRLGSDYVVTIPMGICPLTQ